MALLVMGTPGVGKTTALRAVAADLRRTRLGGFYTEEVRRRGVRTGFRLVTFAGERRMLASVHRAGPPRVSTYGVDVAALDDVVETALARSGVGRPCVATVTKRGEGFIAEVKRRPDVELWEITRTNRDAMPARILARLGAAA